ncbi:MAG: ribonuclease E/G [Clostridiales bacterium]|nr:ribonuclease E/G [Clostridiales bacterium]
MTNTGKILIVKGYNRLLSLLIRDNQILAAQAQKEELGGAKDAYEIGNIYIGRVQKLAANIGAAFVDLGGGYLTFLPLSEAADAYVANREADGTLRVGDEVLVQIVKEPMKTKLAGVTARISRAGSYAVVGLPGAVRKAGKQGAAPGKAEMVQVSSKLGSKQQKSFRSIEALQQIAAVCPLIVRTNAGELETEEPLIAEAQRLYEELQHITAIARNRTCYSCLYRSKPDYVEFVQNMYRTEYDEVITDLPEVYETLKAEVADRLPNPIPVRLYEDPMLPLYKLYAVEIRVKELLDQKVWLKSGGYLVIEPTEALISIDVNSGKYIKGKDKEETFLRINLEAAEMIALQLRARNLSGMILVDFINMERREHEAQLVEYMRSLLKKDAVKAHVVDMTGLGLLELTRKKISPSFAEQIRRSGS